MKSFITSFFATCGIFSCTMTVNGMEEPVYPSSHNFKDNQGVSSEFPHDKLRNHEYMRNNVIDKKIDNTEKLTSIKKDIEFEIGSFKQLSEKYINTFSNRQEGEKSKFVTENNDKISELESLLHSIQDSSSPEDIERKLFDMRRSRVLILDVW